MLARVVVAVCGAGRAATPEQLAIAEQVGAGLARLGVVVLTGGRGGVMEAASRGAASQGGLTVALLPSDDPAEANPWVAVPLSTGLGRHRNGVIVHSARYVVAIGGEYGTATEIAAALDAGRRVVACLAPELHLPGVSGLPIVRVDDAAGAIDAVCRWLEDDGLAR